PGRPRSSRAAQPCRGTTPAAHPRHARPRRPRRACRARDVGGPADGDHRLLEEGRGPPLLGGGEEPRAPPRAPGMHAPPRTHVPREVDRTAGAASIRPGTRVPRVLAGRWRPDAQKTMGRRPGALPGLLSAPEPCRTAHAGAEVVTRRRVLPPAPRGPP